MRWEEQWRNGRREVIGGGKDVEVRGNGTK